MKLLALLLLLSAPLATPLAAQTLAPQPLVAGVSQANYPRVDGSTSTAPLGALLAAQVWGFEGELRRGQQRSYQTSLASVFLTFPVAAAPERINEFHRKYQAHAHQGTGKAYQNLIAGQRDLILVARPPSASESAQAKKTGVTLELRPIARDALVFVVNASNPVENLTTAQLRAIFGGQTRLWRLVGGRDLPILALTRNSNSGSQELMDALLPPAPKTLPAEPNTRVDSMGEVIDRVASNPHAVGYTVFYYERFMTPRPQNRLLSVNGIAPTPATLADGSYPFVAPVYAVIRGGPKAPQSAVTLRDWLSSAAGQSLIARSGYVPDSPPAEKN